MQFRLPEELRTLEHPLREKIARRVKRGKLMCALSVDLVGAHALELNRPLLLQLLAALEQVRRGRARGAQRPIPSICCAGPAC